MVQQVTAKRISEAYKGLGNARIELHGCIERELGAKSTLKIKEAQLLMSGAIIGKNAEAREAQLREALGIEHLEEELAREARAKAQLSYELAAMAVDELKLLMRIDELYGGEKL